MEEDREIQAISKVNSALKDLTEDERYRVIQWVANKYVQNSAPLKLAGSAVVNPPAGVIEDGAGDEDVQAQDSPQTYDTFAEMLDASGADTEDDRFLVAAYWIQVKTSQQAWRSFQINKLLKDTGRQIKISNALKRLLGSKPALVVQVSKNAAGTKTLKLTTEGIKKVNTMLGQDQ